MIVLDIIVKKNKLTLHSAKSAKSASLSDACEKSDLCQNCIDLFTSEYNRYWFYTYSILSASHSFSAIKYKNSFSKASKFIQKIIHPGFRSHLVVLPIRMRL